MADDLLNRNLQESVLTLLVHDDKCGRVIANMLTYNQFDGDYADVARGAMSFWAKHKEAPKHHMDDILSDVLTDKSHPKRPAYFSILQHMIQLYDAGLNTKFYIDHVYRFARMQQFKSALIVAANKINSKSDMALEELEDSFHDLLKTRQVTFDPGMRLTDITPVLVYFATKQEEFICGIDELDSAGVVPARDAVMLLLGATGKGKSWGLIHLAKHALLQRMKVLHVTLEMPKEEVIQRYWQSLYSMGRKEIAHKVTTIQKDTFGRIEALNVEDVDTEFAFNSPYIADELANRLQWAGSKFHDNLRVISYPSGSLRVRDLEAYLDTMQQIDGFVPDMVILDYIGLMRNEHKEHRFGLNANMVGIRGIASERHIAMVTAQQVGRQGAKSTQINLTHVAEDWSLTNTADIVLTYTSTDNEEQYGLGRLYVAKARGAPDHFGVLLSQNYAIGQFAIDSARLSDKWQDRIKELVGFEPASQEDPDEEDDDDDESEDVKYNHNRKGRR